MVVTIAAVALIGAADIFVPRGLNDALGPRLVPIVVGAALAVLGAILGIRAWISDAAAPPDPGSLVVVGVLIAAMLGFLVLFQLAGFIVTCVLFLGSLFWYLGEQRWWLVLLSAATVSVVVYVLFADLLNVNLPTGPWGF